MIIFTYFDSSTNNAPAGFFTAVNAAVEYWERAIVNPIQVTIEFGWGQIAGQPLASGALGESEVGGVNLTYAQVKSALTSHATSANQITAVHSLPATDPTHGAMFFVPDPEAIALGLAANNSSQVEGAIGMASNAPFAYNPFARAVAGDYDAIGTMEHEISEVLGRIAGSGMLQGGVPQFSPLDLFRYTGPGKLALTPEAASFSINGGATLLRPFNNPVFGDDAGDWAPSVVGDAFGEGFRGVAAPVSALDLELMNVLGFQLAADPTARNDFNADGKSDFLIENTAGAVDVGEDHNNVATLSQVTTLASTWKFVADGDFLGAGSDQFLIQNAAGALDDGQEVAGGKETLQPIGTLATGWKFVGVGDFLGLADGDQFLVESSTGAVMVGNAISGSAVYTQISVLPSVWKFVGAGNFLGTGPSEFLIESTAGAVDIGQVVNNKAVFTPVGALGAQWKFVGGGDFLNDGKDQFLIESTTGAVDVGEIDANKIVLTQIATLSSAWKFVGTGDYTGEGHDSFLIESTAGAIDIGDFIGGQLHLTQIGSLGSIWTFH